MRALINDGILQAGEKVLSFDYMVRARALNQPMWCWRDLYVLCRRLWCRCSQTSRGGPQRPYRDCLFFMKEPPVSSHPNLIVSDPPRGDDTNFHTCTPTKCT